MSVPVPYVDRKRLRVGTFAAAALTVAWAAMALLPAVAAAEEKENTTQFAVTAGTLVFFTTPLVPGLPSVTIKGEAQTTNATMGNFAVQDATGSGSGWNVAVKGNGGGAKNAQFKQYCPEAACGTVGYVTSGIELPANSLTLNSTGASF